MSMTSASANPIHADPADLLPGCPELQVPSGTITLAEENLYHMMELLASSDNLSFDLHLKYIERIAAVQEKLLAMRKAIYQLDCAAADRQSADQAANMTAAIAPAAPSATAQPAANSTAAIAAIDAVAASDSPDQSRSLNESQSSTLNQPPAALAQIAPIPEIPPLVPLPSGFAHLPAKTKSATAISSAMAAPSVAATPATPATPATRACSVNQIMEQLSQAIAGIDQLSSEIQINLEKAAPAAEQTTTLSDPPSSTNVHQHSTPSQGHNRPSAAPPSTNSLISDA